MFKRKKTFLALSGFLLAGVLAACGSPANEPETEPLPEQLPEEAGLFTPGTFVGVGDGYLGEISVEVVFDADRIEGITVLEHCDTEGFALTAFSSLILDVLDFQSPNIDGVSGATATSNGFLDAVRDAIKQAGANPDDLLVVAVENNEEVTVLEADVIVVGGGLAGLSSAIVAAQNDASVILIEKRGILGGASRASGGGISGSETQFQAAVGIELSNETFSSYWISEQLLSPQNPSQFPDAGRIENIVANSSNRLDWLYELGFRYDAPDPNEFFGQGRIHFPEGGMMGGLLIDFLEATARDLGVEVFTNTRGLELIQADDRIVGVVAEGQNGETMVLEAGNGVVLATGGFAQNAELMSRFVPQMYPFMALTAAPPGHMGDGIIMAEAVGAVPYEEAWVIGMGLASPVPGMPMTIMTPGMYVLINHEGQRYMNESLLYSVHTAKTAHYAPFGGFVVVDNNEMFAGLIPDEANIDNIHAFTADTLEELALLLNVDADNFLATLDHVAAVAAGEVEDEFGRPDFMSVSLTQGPFFATRYLPMNMGTMGGVMVDPSTQQVIDGFGNPIPGLFAAGEMSNRSYYNQIYIGGSALLVALNGGMIAGESAAASN